MSIHPPESPASLLVVSAHAGDFVWRAGGAIALAAERGERATVVCLSYGERGESARAWREGRQLAEIKEIRRAEAENVKVGQMRRLLTDTGELDQIRNRLFLRKITEFLRGSAEITEVAA